MLQKEKRRSKKRRRRFVLKSVQTNCSLRLGSWVFPSILRYYGTLAAKANLQRLLGRRHKLV